MSGKLWEVDPETKSKLAEIAKTNENGRCVDCGAPSPQWVCHAHFLMLSCKGLWWLEPRGSMRSLTARMAGWEYCGSY